MNVNEGTVHAIVSILSANVPDEETPQFDIRVPKKGVTVLAGQLGEVKCRVRA